MATMNNLRKQKPRHGKITIHTRERWSIPNFQGGGIADQLIAKCRKLNDKCGEEKGSGVLISCRSLKNDSRPLFLSAAQRLKVLVFVAPNPA